VSIEDPARVGAERPAAASAGRGEVLRRKTFAPKMMRFLAKSI
jgi:hypothetical protein